MIARIACPKMRGHIMSSKIYFLIACLALPVLSSEMEAVLEVGRNNSELSAESQDRIDATDTATDKIVNEWQANETEISARANKGLIRTFEYAGFEPPAALMN